MYILGNCTQITLTLISKIWPPSLNFENSNPFSSEKTYPAIAEVSDTKLT